MTPSRTPSTAPATASESLAAAPPAADLQDKSWWQPISEWMGSSNLGISGVLFQESSSKKESHDASTVSFSQPATLASASANHITVPSASPFHATADSTPRKQTPQASQAPPAEEQASILGQFAPQAEGARSFETSILGQFAPQAEGARSFETSIIGQFAPQAEGARSFEALRAESRAAIDGAIEAAHQATSWLFSDNMVPQEEAVSNQLDDRHISPRGSPLVATPLLPGPAQYPAQYAGGYRMWARINVAQFQQTNRVNLMQIDMLSLGVLQTQMDNLTMQSTLMIGFAMTMFAGETLNPLVNDQSQMCVYKSWYHMLFGLIFFMSVTTSTSCGLILVVITSFIKQV